MAAKKTGADDAARIGKALEPGTAGEDPGGYEISSAFAAPARRKLMGSWKVVEHLIGGTPFLERFQAQQLKGAELEDGLYLASYEFRETICIKKVSVEGRLATEEGPIPYEYRLAVALSWRPGPSKSIIVRPEMGYQMSSIDGKPAACRDLASSGEEMRLSWRIEGRDLVLEEGEDKRLLRRA